MSTRLRVLRKDKGVFQKDVAKHIGVAESTYSYWEQGKIEIDFENLRKLADFFNVSIDYLLGHSESPTPENKKAPTGFPMSASEFYSEIDKMGISDEDYASLPDEKKQLLLSLIKEVIDNNKNKR